MPRETKPYWKTQQQRWVCTIDGKRITLGADRKAAFAKFRSLMQRPESVGDHIVTLYALSQVYLDWCQKHRASGTYENHKRYLKSFIESCGRKLAGCVTVTRHLSYRKCGFGRSPRDRPVGVAEKVKSVVRPQGRVFCCDHQENCDKLPDHREKFAFLPEMRQLAFGCSKVEFF